MKQIKKKFKFTKSPAINVDQEINTWWPDFFNGGRLCFIDNAVFRSLFYFT